MTTNPKVKIENIVELSDEIRGGDGQMTSQLVFSRKMRVGDLRAFDGSTGETDGMIKLVSKLTNVTPSEVEKIPLDDWPKVMEVVNSFLKSFAEVAKRFNQTAASTER